MEAIKPPTNKEHTMDNKTKIAKEYFLKALSLRSKADSYAHCDATRIPAILEEAADYDTKCMNACSLLSFEEIEAWNTWALAQK